MEGRDIMGSKQILLFLVLLGLFFYLVNRLFVTNVKKIKNRKKQPKLDFSDPDKVVEKLFDMLGDEQKFLD